MATATATYASTTPQSSTIKSGRPSHGRYQPTAMATPIASRVRAIVASGAKPRAARKTIHPPAAAAAPSATDVAVAARTSSDESKTGDGMSSTHKPATSPLATAVSTALDCSCPELTSTVVSMPKTANAPCPSESSRSASVACVAASRGNANRSRWPASPRGARDHQPGEDEAETKTRARIARDSFAVLLGVSAGEHRKQDEGDREQELVRQKGEELRRAVRANQLVGLDAQRIGDQTRAHGGLMGEAAQQPDVRLHEQVQKKLADGHMGKNPEMPPQRGPASARAAGTSDVEGEGQNARGSHRHAHRAAHDPRLPPAEVPGEAEQPDSPQRGERDIETRLRKEAPAPVQRSNQWRVERVDEKDEGEDLERPSDVRSVLEIRDDWREDGKQTGETGRERAVDEQRPAVRGSLAGRASLGDRTRDGLD